MKSLKILTLAVIMAASSLQSFAQDFKEKTLLTVGNEKITAGEFLNIYNKNNVQSEAIDPKTINEYLDLFINFRLKVKDAEVQGLDTMKSFKDELAGYRKQLAQPYFTDESVIDLLTKEAYDRSQYDIRASHILIRCAADALPADTLTAWKKINDIRKKIMKGADFSKMATELSEDQSARDREANKQHPAMKGNRGDLGYFTVFNMVYPFETAAFNTPVGSVSQIIRTDFGYHLIKVVDRHPALGKVTAAHIFFTFPKNSTAADSARVKSRVDSIYNRLNAGEKWDDLATLYSDDKASAAKGGQLPPFTSNRLVPDFIEAVYLLKNPGDYSKPVLTSYGWHIIKLVEKKTPGTFDESKAELKQRVTRDNRGRQSQEVVVARLKAEYKLYEDIAVLKEVTGIVTDSIFAGTWNPAPDKIASKTLFSFADKKVTQSEFAQYLLKHQKKQEAENIQVYVNKRFKDYVNETILSYEDNQLEAKYPDFKALVKEYRDGILLFELTDRLVWTKAVKDTTGLRVYYQTVKQKYMWPDRKEVSMLTINNLSSERDAAIMLTKLEKWITKKGKSLNWVKTELMKDTLLSVNLTQEKYIAGENALADKTAPETNQSEISTKDSKTLLTWAFCERAISPEPKTLEEVKGLVTAEYQNQLEKEWIEKLRKQYPFEVDRLVLDQIK
ncbi:MAG: hypothetical protein A2X11_07655 [Bacteroidetes bacterium GWE2_42_24]|nr:MAG: hypothetical protein A2X11_07655 [Bacteroidetes bacterium GWE2_42_24]OFY26487.1 MAG: hypothetical protein A2X09_02300 [Bacteroidetes bacterium GWF2_43_11]